MKVHKALNCWCGQKHTHQGLPTPPPRPPEGKQKYVDAIVEITKLNMKLVAALEETVKAWDSDGLSGMPDLYKRLKALLAEAKKGESK